MRFKVFFKLLDVELEVYFESLTELVLTQPIYIKCSDEVFAPFKAFNLLHEVAFGFEQVDEFKHEHLIQVRVEDEV